MFDIPGTLLVRCQSPQGAVVMMLVMKLLKFPALLTKLPKMSKGLATEELSIKIKLKMFYNSITLGLTYRNKDRLYSQVQTEPNNNTERMRIMITAPTGKKVIHL